MNASDYYQLGQIEETIKALNDEVKHNPTDIGKRAFLCEMLCFAGNLDRADTQLDAMSKQDPKAAPGIALFRQLVRAEQARQQFFTEGRVPEFLTEPSASMKLALEASIRIREGETKQAAELLAQAEEARPKVSGSCNGEAFADFRDLDDLTAGVFEVLTSTGKYYWAAIESVIEVEFQAPQHPRDLLWRSAHMSVRNGPEGEVFIPAIYAGSLKENDLVKLGRATEWRGGDGEPARGVGLRSYLLGEQDRTILELETINFDQPAE